MAAKETNTKEKKATSKAKPASYSYALGRRKTATATVRLFSNSADSSVNEKPVAEYFPMQEADSVLAEPFKALDLKSRDFHFTAKTSGGGINSQLEAIRLGIARALVNLNPEYKKDLKSKGLLTRDPRMVERKKPGLRKARRAEQFSKR